MSTAVFLNLPTHGHINPTLPLVAKLVRRGERVVYYSLPEFEAKIAPQQPEQGAVVDRMAAVGAEIHLPNDQATPATLRETVARVLADPSYAARSQAMGDTLRAAGGCLRAADVVCAFKARLGLD